MAPVRRRPVARTAAPPGMPRGRPRGRPHRWPGRPATPRFARGSPATPADTPRRGVPFRKPLSQRKLAGLYAPEEQEDRPHPPPAPAVVTTSTVASTTPPPTARAAPPTPAPSTARPAARCPACLRHGVPRPADGAHVACPFASCRDCWMCRPGSAYPGLLEQHGLDKLCAVALQPGIVDAIVATPRTRRVALEVVKPVPREAPNTQPPLLPAPRQPLRAIFRRHSAAEVPLRPGQRPAPRWSRVEPSAAQKEGAAASLPTAMGLPSTGAPTSAPATPLGVPLTMPLTVQTGGDMEALASSAVRAALDMLKSPLGKPAAIVAPQPRVLGPVKVRRSSGAKDPPYLASLLVRSPKLRGLANRGLYLVFKSKSEPRKAARKQASLKRGRRQSATEDVFSFPGDEENETDLLRAARKRRRSRPRCPRCCVHGGSSTFVRRHGEDSCPHRTCTCSKCEFLEGLSQSLKPKSPRGTPGSNSNHGRERTRSTPSPRKLILMSPPPASSEADSAPWQLIVTPRQLFPAKAPIKQSPPKEATSPAPPPVPRELTAPRPANTSAHQDPRTAPVATSPAVPREAPGVVQDAVVEGTAMEDAAMDDGVVADNIVEDAAIDDGVVADNIVEDAAIDDAVVADNIVEDAAMDDAAAADGDHPDGDEDVGDDDCLVQHLDWQALIEADVLLVSVEGGVPEPLLKSDHCDSDEDAVFSIPAAGVAASSEAPAPPSSTPTPAPTSPSTTSASPTPTSTSIKAPSPATPRTGVASVEEHSNVMVAFLCDENAMEVDVAEHSCAWCGMAFPSEADAERHALKHAEDDDGVEELPVENQSSDFSMLTIKLEVGDVDAAEGEEDIIEDYCYLSGLNPVVKTEIADILEEYASLATADAAIKAEDFDQDEDNVHVEDHVVKEEPLDVREEEGQYSPSGEAVAAEEAPAPARTPALAPGPVAAVQATVDSMLAPSPPCPGQNPVSPENRLRRTSPRKLKTAHMITDDGRSVLVLRMALPPPSDASAASSAAPSSASSSSSQPEAPRLVVAQQPCADCPESSFPSIAALAAHRRTRHARPSASSEAASSEATSSVAATSSHPPQTRGRGPAPSKEVAAKHPCADCPQSCFPSMAALATHRLTEHAVVTWFRCPCCDEAFDSAAAQRVHVTTVHALPAHGCPECDERLPSTLLLRAHRMLTHGADAGPVGLPCPVPRCGAALPTVALFDKHMRSQHRSISDISCYLCRATTPTLVRMLAHVKTHVKELRDLVCKQCASWFPSADLLRAHRRAIHGAPSAFPYPCPLCPSKYKLAHPLGQHMESHHPGQIFYACWCGLRFAAPDALYKHARASLHPAMQAAAAARNLQARDSLSALGPHPHGDEPPARLMSMGRVAHLMTLMQDAAVVMQEYGDEAVATATASTPPPSCSAATSTSL